MRPPLTALHVVQPGDGGVARVVTDVVGAQVDLGMRVYVACPPGTPLAMAAGARGAEVLPWRAGREPGPRLVAESRRIADLVGLVRPDLVHAHSAKAGLAARIAVRGRVPTVYQPHAWSFEAADGVTGALARRWERWAARWTDRVICVSEAERRRGEYAGVRASWSVVHNGVDTARFTTGPDRAAARAALGLPASAPLVVCVGRLCRQKGQDTLLEAWPAVLDRVPHARLVLVGDGPTSEALRATAHRLGAPGSVTFAGAVADPAPWYRAADLVVQPSRWEGMALAPLEAMAAGRPVLVTDVDGARESLPPGQETHCLVRPSDPAALGAALAVLLQRPVLREALGRQAQRHVLRRFDVRRAGVAIADVYREVTAAPRPELREPISQ
ncbi:glycosyltransferase [Streptomyces sp. CB03238]|uniref:glycosyltransferase n=1 Tax=Streptomyces sp. CB03238 TaxID=1907777 RepID=UPI000A10A0D4|nr:glycosyltransferase [Streptomyces sp. CB03238]ORT59070.1 glycosyl transferase family 1 [Streptomyces sp. CB03238]